MGYSARRGFSSGSMKATGAQRQAEVQQKIAQMQEAMNTAQEEVEAVGQEELLVAGHLVHLIGDRGGVEEKDSAL